MKKRQKAKKKPTKKGGWRGTRELYQNPRMNERNYPFKMEMVNYFNCKEGKNMIIFLYISKDTNKIVKWRSEI